MKKKWLFMLLGSVYLTQLFLCGLMILVSSSVKYTINPLHAVIVLAVLLLLSVIIILINTVTAFLGLKRSEDNRKSNPLGVIMGFKLGLIPFFISHVFWFLFMMAGSANPFLMILWFFLPFLFSFYAYLVVFATSSYLIAQIIKMGKKRVLSKGKCALHIVWQLLFFSDAIDSVYLFFKYRKRILSMERADINETQ